MIEKIRSLDGWLINGAQEAYLWFYDRTGVYVATVAAVMVLVSTGIGPVKPVGLAITAVLIATFIPIYVLQDKRAFGAFNAMARGHRYGWPRTVCLVIMLACTMTARSLVEVASDILLAIPACYLLTAQIRDREPKDFFANRRLATGGSGA